MGRKKHKAPPFVMVRRDLLKDLTWRKLSNAAKVLYIYLRYKFDFKKVNSEVCLPYVEIKDMMSSKTVSRAFKELIGNQFIEKSVQGGLFKGMNKYKFVGEYKHFYYKGHKV